MDFMSEVMTYAAFMFAISIIQDHASKVDLFVLVSYRHDTSPRYTYSYMTQLTIDEFKN